MEAAKGIHNTEKSSKEIHKRESTEVEKSGSDLKASRRTRLHEKSKRYFERKANGEKVSKCLVNLIKTKPNTRNTYMEMMESTTRQKKTKWWPVPVIVTVRKTYY